MLSWTAPAPPHRLLAGLRGRRHAVLLDSAANHSGQGEWSFLGCDPTRSLSFPAWRPSFSSDRPPARDPFFTVSAALARRPAAAHPEVPFCGGVIGCWGYDLRCRLERLPVLAPDDLKLPDAWAGLYDQLYAYHHPPARGYLVRTPARRESDESARASLERLRAVLEAASGVPPSSPWPAGRDTAGTVESNFTRETYTAAVRRVKEYIAAGDIYQANLSQRFRAALRGSPIALYERLRGASPAPFAAYLDCGDFQVLSSSPERFLRIRGNRIETRPIKGTRPRGGTRAGDAALAAELQASPKDRAELLMIVDLERNDLGRICEYGSVAVPDLYRQETHPTVHHLVATVTARLRPGVRPLDALAACFPGGSITGAPKIRAMQIIEELEPVRRGFYTGAIGYAGYNGNAEWNLAIRTLVVAVGPVIFSAGGGVVADSDPELEWEETLHKSAAMRHAVVG